MKKDKDIESRERKVKRDGEIQKAHHLSYRHVTKDEIMKKKKKRRNIHWVADRSDFLATREQLLEKEDRNNYLDTNSMSNMKTMRNSKHYRGLKLSSTKEQKSVTCNAAWLVTPRFIGERI